MEKYVALNRTSGNYRYKASGKRMHSYGCVADPLHKRAV